MIGYARVSTSGQTLAAQIEQLKAAGCTRIFQETASGARADRPQLKRAIAALPYDGVLRLDLRHDVEKVARRASEAVEPRHHQHTIVGKGGYCPFELRAVCPCP